ncbi:MAG: MBL fold metallo-hydrolase [Patescibacteria group bacterium]
MHISWLGQTCVKLQTKNADQDVVVLLDAYKPKKGEFPRSFSPDIAMFSNGMNEAATLSQNPFVISTLGEFDVKNVMIYTIPCASSENIIFKISAEQLNVVHLGRLKKPLENGDMEKVLGADVLFIPVGGGPNYLDPKSAAALATALEPRVIIPIAHHCETDTDAAAVSAFIKELGLKPETVEKKIIIKKKDLPQEETKLYVLETE